MKTLPINIPGAGRLKTTSWQMHSILVAGIGLRGSDKSQEPVADAPHDYSNKVLVSWVLTRFPRVLPDTHKTMFLSRLSNSCGTSNDLTSVRGPKRFQHIIRIDFASASSRMPFTCIEQPYTPGCQNSLSSCLILTPPAPSTHISILDFTRRTPKLWN